MTTPETPTPGPSDYETALAANTGVIGTLHTNDPHGQVLPDGSRNPAVMDPLPTTGVPTMDAVVAHQGADPYSPGPY